MAPKRLGGQGGGVPCLPSPRAERVSEKKTEKGPEDHGWRPTPGVGGREGGVPCLPLPLAGRGPEDPGMAPDETQERCVRMLRRYNYSNTFMYIDFAAIYYLR